MGRAGPAGGRGRSAEATWSHTAPGPGPGERHPPVWQPAHYCHGCEAVFRPGNTPWRGVLTPEQFKKLVWSDAGYDDQLVTGDKAKNAEIPAGTLPGR